MTRSTANTTAPRLYVDAPLHPRTEIPATAAQAHYLRGVLRRDSGDLVRVFNGADGEYLAHLTVLGKSSMMFVLDGLSRAQAPEPGPWLVFALLKRDATDLVVRQAVELGVSRILPVLSARTNAARVNEDRLRTIVIEAAEQCERLTLPEIASVTKLDAVLNSWPTGRRLFAAIERSGTGAHIPPSAGAGAALLIGPEGGFSAIEQETLRRTAFVTPVSLGPLVLRAETAAAAGLALLLPEG